MAAKQGRQPEALLNEAVQLYLEAAAITDVDPGEVADVQMRLLGELPQPPAWSDAEA